MIALVILNGVLGALWRRVLGGWGEDSRSFIFACGAFLTWPLWLILPPLYALVASGLCLLFFAFGHTLERPWLRYGPFGAGYALAFKFWRNEWNRPPFLDGWTSVGELVAGFLFWGTVAAVILWQ